MATGTLIADTLNCASGVFPTHLDTRGKGGYRTVASVSERDSIDYSLRSVGMLVYVQATGKTYKCTSTASNTWTEVTYADGIDTSLYQLKSNLTNDVASNTTSTDKYPSTKGVVDYIDENYVNSSDYTLSTIDSSGTAVDVPLDDIALGKVSLLTSTSKISTPANMQTTTNLSSDVTTDAESTTKYPSVKSMVDYLSNTYRAKATAITYSEVTGKPTNLQTTDNLSNDFNTDKTSTTKYPSVKSISDYVDENYVLSNDYPIQIQSDAGEKTTATLTDISSGNTTLLTTTSKISYTTLSDKPTIPTVPTSLKNPTALTVTLNGGATEGTNRFTYDGSAAKTINITAASVGALTTTATLSATTTIKADTLYVASASLSSLAVTKATESLSANYAHEYKMQFIAGADFTPTFTGFGTGIKWLNGTTPACVSGKTYEISICNELGIIAEFS